MNKRVVFLFMVLMPLLAPYYVNADTLFIPHSAFHPAHDYVEYSIGDYYVVKNSAPGTLVAPIYLPQGAVVDGVFLFFEDSDNNNIQCYLIRVNPDKGNCIYQFPLSTQGSTPGIRHISNWRVTLGSRTINRDAFTYYIQLYFTGYGGAYKVYGVRIHYH